MNLDTMIFYQWLRIIQEQFAEIYRKIWGNSKSNDKLKAEFNSILIRKGCTFMKIPHLNPNIYCRISDPIVNKDKAAPGEAVMANIPLMRGYCLIE